MSRISPTWAVPLIVALVAVASAALFASGGARLADGTPALALDDSYIHLQYAWQAAQGHLLIYSTGDQPTTGATSLLFMLLLAGGYTLGISHLAMPDVVITAGGILLAASAALLSDVARRLATTLNNPDEVIPPWGVGLLAGVLYAESGWMTWAYESGMETGLLLTLVIGVLWAVIARRPTLLVVFAVLAALTRPEAMLLGLVLLVVEWLLPDPASAGHRWRGRNQLLLPLAAAAIVIAINSALTGFAGSSGLQAKSLFTLVPLYPRQVFELMVARGSEVALRLFGGLTPDGFWHVFPATQLLAAFGLWLMWGSSKPLARRVALVGAGWVVLGVGATTSLQTALWHHYRYQMPFFPTLLLPMAVALAWLVSRVARSLGKRGPLLARALLTVVVAGWCGYSLSVFRQQFGRDTGTIASMQLVLADWLRDNTPPEARIAAHDVGAIGYLSGRSLIDVVGLTSPGMATSYRNGPGSIYEALENAKPDYYAVYASNTTPPYYLDWAGNHLRGKELFTVSLHDFSPFTSATGTQIISKPDWSNVSLAETPHQPDILARLKGWRMSDQLDVADLTSEQAHSYAWWDNGEPPGFPSDARQFHYRVDPQMILADGGRLLTGGESFVVATRPGQALQLVSRINQTADMVLAVQVDGREAGLWRLPAIPGEWLESSFVVPADQISNTATHISLAIKEITNGTPETRYSPFFYWAYQGDRVVTPPPAPQSTRQAVFGGALKLLGYDLDKHSFAPGETINLTLHWQALSPPHADLRVFVHVVDPARSEVAEGIIAQADSAPEQGTRPFWLWEHDEVGLDTITLSIPLTARPGLYPLLIGVYDAESGQRLPISAETDFGSGRLILETITIR